MNSLEREEELERLAKLLTQETAYLRRHVKAGEHGYAEYVLRYIMGQATDYFERQEGAVS